MTGWTGGSQPAWVLGRVNAGAPSLTFQNGQVTATAVRNGVGNYSLSWPSTGAATAYVQLTCSAFGGGPKFANYVMFRVCPVLLSVIRLLCAILV